MFTIEIFVGSSVKRILLENAKISTGTPCGGLKAAPGYKKSSPSYKLNSLNFDSENLSVETLWDHLKEFQ